MPANRGEPESVHFWFQSNKKSPAWQPPTFAGMARSYRSAVGGRHAGDSGWSCDWPATLSTGYLLKIPGQLGKNPGP